MKFKIYVHPREIIDYLPDARKLSWRLLSQVLNEDESFEGEDASSNLGLAIFEQALDWAIGMKVREIIIGCWQRYRRLPKPFTLEVDTNSGNIEAVFPSGRRL